VESPRLLSEKRPEPRPQRPRRERNELSAGLTQWLAACRGGTQSQGSFLGASGISEAVNLYAVALRTQQKLQWDAAARRVSNSEEANKYLSRQYRKGWDPKTI
jgi:hypothetical protein